MKWLITILILAIVLIAGCTQTVSNIGAQTGIGITSIGDIVKNPEIYENKTVTIKGTTIAAFPVEMKLTDDQGYLMELGNCEETGRNLDYGVYKATGIINYSESCNCQVRMIINITKEDLEDFQIKNNVPQITKDNIECISGDCLFAFSVSPDEGWQDWAGGTMKQQIDPLSCKSSIASWNYYRIFFNSTWAEVNTEKIMERRCEPNSTQKNYYLECTEPMVKIS